MKRHKARLKTWLVYDAYLCIWWSVLTAIVVQDYSAYVYVRKLRLIGHLHLSLACNGSAIMKEMSCLGRRSRNVGGRVWRQLSYTRESQFVIHDYGYESRHSPLFPTVSARSIPKKCHVPHQLELCRTLY